MIDAGTGTGAAIKAIVPFGVKGIVNRLKGLKEDFRTRKELNEYYAHVKSPSKPDTILKKIEEKYLTIRTLAFPERLVSIKDIYHPLKVYFPDRGITHEVDDKQLFFLDKLVVVVGVAGQGKTTTIRKLIHKELYKGEEGRIPVMISMREIDWNETDLDIFKVISRGLREIGIVINHAAIETCMVKKSFLLCFDGFDEVPLNQRQSALRMLLKGYTYTRNPLIVTSRPNTEITTEMGNIEIVKLKNIEPDDVVKIITKNKNLDNSYKELLIRSYKENNEIKGVIVTPILVDIFTVVYGRVQITPKNIVEFYEELYYGLTDKHDRFKQLERDKKSKLNNLNLLKVLTRVSFHTSISLDSHSFSYSKGVEIFKESLDKLEYQDDPRHVLQDVVDRTSLIINDGDQYSYLHKSIMEFYSAKFIATRSNDAKKEIYKYISDNYSYKFENVLRFLKELDPCYFYECFVIYQVELSGLLDLFELEKIHKNVAMFMNFPLSILYEKSNEYTHVRVKDYNFPNTINASFRLASVFQVLDLFELVRTPSIIQSIQDCAFSSNVSFLNQLVKKGKCLHSENYFTEAQSNSYIEDMNYQSTYDLLIDEYYECIGKVEASSMNKSIKSIIDTMYKKLNDLKLERDKENDINDLLSKY